MFDKILILLTSLVLCIAVFGEVPAKSLKDPTAPFGVTPTIKSETGFQIEGIIIGKNRKIVTINGKNFTVGDVVMGAIITEIKPHEVFLKDESGNYTISMSNVNIKKPVNK